MNKSITPLIGSVPAHIAEQMYQALLEERAAYEDPLAHVNNACEAYESWRTGALGKPEQPAGVLISRERFNALDGMAASMDLLRKDLARGGIVTDDVPPMFMTEGIRAAIQRAVSLEREACAVACEDRHDSWRFGDSQESGPMECARAIRARTEGCA